MKKLITVVALGITAMAQAQTTTTTNCSTNGNQTNCTSNTVDYGEQQRQAYAAGAAVGTAIGNLIGSGIQAHKIHSLRDQKCQVSGPGSEWVVESSMGERWTGICTAKQARVKLAKTYKSPTRTLPSVQTAAATPGSDDVNSDDTKLVQQRAASFLANHPEWIVCQENSKPLLAYVSAHVKGDQLPTSDDFEHAYAALKPMGVFKLRPNTEWTK